MGGKVQEQKENAASNDFTVSVDLPTALQRKKTQFIEEKKIGFEYFKRGDTIKTLLFFIFGGLLTAEEWQLKSAVSPV